MMLTGAELAYLSALLGAETLVGMEDPFRGLLADEVGAALRQARERLIGRGWLTLRPDGSLLADGDLAAAVRVCGAPGATLKLSGGAGCIHLAGEMAVVMAPVGDQYQLTVLCAPGDVERYLAAVGAAVEQRMGGMGDAAYYRKA